MTSDPHVEGLNAGTREELLPLVEERLENKIKLLSKQCVCDQLFLTKLLSKSVYAFTCLMKSGQSQIILLI